MYGCRKRYLLIILRLRHVRKFQPNNVFRVKFAGELLEINR
jgi:hypothetical protein